MRVYFLRKVDAVVDSDLNMAPVSCEPRSSSSWGVGALPAADAFRDDTIINYANLSHGIDPTEVDYEEIMVGLAKMDR